MKSHVQSYVFGVTPISSRILATISINIKWSPFSFKHLEVFHNMRILLKKNIKDSAPQNGWGWTSFNGNGWSSVLRSWYYIRVHFRILIASIWMGWWEFEWKCMKSTDALNLPKEPNRTRKVPLVCKWCINLTKYTRRFRIEEEEKTSSLA